VYGDNTLLLTAETTVDATETPFSSSECGVAVQSKLTDLSISYTDLTGDDLMSCFIEDGEGEFAFVLGSNKSCPQVLNGICNETTRKECDTGLECLVDYSIPEGEDNYGQMICFEKPVKPTELYFIKSTMNYGVHYIAAALEMSIWEEYVVDAINNIEECQLGPYTYLYPSDKTGFVITKWYNHAGQCTIDLMKTAFTEAYKNYFNNNNLFNKVDVQVSTIMFSTETLSGDDIDTCVDYRNKWLLCEHCTKVPCDTGFHCVKDDDCGSGWCAKVGKTIETQGKSDEDKNDDQKSNDQKSNVQKSNDQKSEENNDEQGEKNETNGSKGSTIQTLQDADGFDLEDGVESGICATNVPVVPYSDAVRIAIAPIIALVVLALPLFN
jgi:hypothetical protein